MAYAPQTWNNDDTNTPLSAARLTVMETGIEDADTRATALERGVVTPVVITYASSITPDATAGRLFTCTATGNLTLNEPTGGVDGQTVTVEITASGGDRIVSFAGGAVFPVVVQSGKKYTAVLRYSSGDTTWLLVQG